MSGRSFAIRQAGVFAGGHGSRIRTGLDTLKPLVPVSGRTLVERVLGSIAEVSPEEVTLLINEDSTSVREAVSRAHWPFAVRWIVETTPSSMHSFLRVLETMAAHDDGPLLLSTVDTVAVPGAYREFAAEAGRRAADVVLAVNAAGDDESPLLVRVGPDGRRVEAIGQAARTERARAVGALAQPTVLATCGVYSVRASVLREADAARAEGLTALRLFLARLLDRGYSVEAIRVRDSVDVDRPGDVSAAEALLKSVTG